MLSKQTCTISHLNTRMEKHGEDDILACDISITADVPNSILDAISPGLREAIFDKPADQMDLSDDHRSVLRFPCLAPLVWDEPIEAASFTIHGSRKEDNMDFAARVRKLVLSPKEGGTVTLKFQAQVLPTAAEVGELTELLGQTIKVSFKPAAPLAPPLE